MNRDQQRAAWAYEAVYGVPQQHFDNFRTRAARSMGPPDP
jgi:hypothetical protein